MVVLSMVSLNAGDGLYIFCDYIFFIYFVRYVILKGTKQDVQ